MSDTPSHWRYESVTRYERIRGIKTDYQCFVVYSGSHEVCEVYYEEYAKTIVDAVNASIAKETP